MHKQNSGERIKEYYGIFYSGQLVYPASEHVSSCLSPLKITSPLQERFKFINFPFFLCKRNAYFKTIPPQQYIQYKCHVFLRVNFMVGWLLYPMHLAPFDSNRYFKVALRRKRRS